MKDLMTSMHIILANFELAGCGLAFDNIADDYVWAYNKDGKFKVTKKELDIMLAKVGPDDEMWGDVSDKAN